MGFLWAAASSVKLQRSVGMELSFLLMLMVRRVFGDKNRAYPCMIS